MTLQVPQPAPARWKAPFFAVWTGQAVSLLGSSLVQFALVWWLTKTTGSATVLAMATLVAMLPGIFLGPFAGALVDRWNRRTVMMVSDGLVALLIVGLAVLARLGLMQTWHIYLVMFLRAIAGAFQWPAMQASTSLMVPNEYLPRVAGLNQALFGATGIIAPPVGALLLGVLPRHGIMLVDVGTAAAAVAILSLVAIPQPERRAGGQVTPAMVWADVREGLRYVRGWPGLLVLMAFATMLNFLLTPAFSLIPILVTRHFNGEALQLGWMNSMEGFGVVLGGLLLGVWGGFRRRIATSMAGLVVMGIGVLTIGVAPASAFGLALAGIFVAGLMNAMVNGPLMAILQGVVSPDMQGRVFTVLQSAAAGMSPLSMAVAGPLADALGVQTWYLVGGVACVIMGISGLFMPVLMHLEDNHQPAPPLPVNPLPVEE
jgi:DHA3 family macrolide efflux protein-like MFS transporter